MPSSSLFARSQRPPNSGRRWLLGLAFLLLILMASVLVLAAVGSSVQSGVRAYVGGEGLWSKAQKDAIFHLARYMETRSEANWDGYLREIGVTLGDSRARVELERPDPDMAVVADGLIAGGNAPEDVAAMALVFRSFRHIGYMDRAIGIWAAADAEIEGLQEIANRIRSAVLADDKATSAALSAELEAANVRLTALEDEFSQTLSEGARWVQGVLLALKAIIVALLVIISAAIGRFMVVRLRATDLAAAESLRANEARLRLLFEHLPAIVWTTDNQLTLTSLTGDGLSRLGIDETALVGRPLDDLFDDVETDDYSAANRSALHGTGGGSYRATVGGRTFEVHVEPLTVDRRVAGAIGVGLDLTDRLELEARLERSTRMESIGRLAGGVAHDFNNLLTAITGYSDLLVSGLPNGEQRQDAEEIRRAAKRATDLTGQLLAVGRRSVLKPERVSPNVVIQEMRNMLRRVIGDEIAVQFELDPEIPFVLADPGQLEQVILNLAVNARDAMPDGGRLVIATKAVHTDRDRPGAPSRVDIVVSDTGVGMDEATQTRIFEPFFTTKAQGKGTGLGLSTAYGIVSQSGGSIRVVSELGAGASFTITLAGVAAVSAEEPGPAEPFSVATAPRTLRRLALPHAASQAVGAGPATGLVATDLSAAPTILVAEDEPAVRSLVEHVLRAAGFTVVAAVDGREALDLAGEMPTIDLLLTDVMMPRLNGPDLAEALRERRPDQRVLFMSGFTNDVLGERGIMSPNIELLPKPFAPDALIARVRAVLAAPIGQFDGRGEVA